MRAFSFPDYGADMALTLAEYLDEMNRHLPSIRRHPNRGERTNEFYLGHDVYVTIDCDLRDMNEDAPQTIHAKTPEEE
jgi:hypothetical protein